MDGGHLCGTPSGMQLRSEAAIATRIPVSSVGCWLVGAAVGHVLGVDLASGPVAHEARTNRSGAGTVTVGSC